MAVLPLEWLRNADFIGVAGFFFTLRKRISTDQQMLKMLILLGSQQITWRKPWSIKDFAESLVDISLDTGHPDVTPHGLW